MLVGHINHKQRKRFNFFFAEIKCQKYGNVSSAQRRIQAFSQSIVCNLMPQFVHANNRQQQQNMAAWRRQRQTAVALAN